MRPLIYILALWVLIDSCGLAVKRANNLYAKYNTQKPVYDAIVVPGVPYKLGNWDSVMKARVLWSVYLYKNGYAKNIIYSGAAVYSPYYEAIIMGLYAQKMGVPPQHIYYDTLAKHSTENVYYSYKLAKKLGFKSLALATDPFQSALLNTYTKKRFRSPVPHLPIHFETLKTLDQSTPEIDPEIAFKPTFVSIVEQERFFKRLKGTMGKQVYYGPDKVLGKL